MSTNLPANVEILQVPITRTKFRVRLLPEHDIIDQLEKLAIAYQLDIGFAEFRMIGAVNEVNYQVSEIEKDSAEKKGIVNEKREAELLWCAGTIAWDSKNPSVPKVHGHIIFADNSDPKHIAFGGHLNKGTKIWITAEIIIDVLSGEKLFREDNPDVGGANLWKPFGIYPPLRKK